MWVRTMTALNEVIMYQQRTITALKDSISTLRRHVELLQQQQERAQQLAARLAEDIRHIHENGDQTLSVTDGELRLALSWAPQGQA